MEDLIKNGNMNTQARLSDYVSTSHFYAVGIATGLKGYIQIMDGKPYNSSIVNGNLVIDSSFNQQATLLLYAEVDDWKEFDLSADIKTWRQLEQFISNQAIKYHVPKNCASPFLLIGTVADARWSVVDWPANDQPLAYKTMNEAGMHGEIHNEEIKAIGFYSHRSAEVLAHKETNINIHFLNHDHSIAGRLDDITLDGRLKLLLPKNLVVEKKQ